MMPRDGVLCRLLEWDSEFFGFPIGRLEPHRLTGPILGKAREWCEGRGIRCLYVLVDCDDPETIRQAAKYGLDFIDIRMVFRRKLETPPMEPHVTADIRHSRREDMTVLKELAADLFRDSRFCQDGRFPPHRSAALYTEWVKKSCEAAEGSVLVAEASGRPVGFITCDPVDSRVGRIGLCGVHESGRQKGLGTGLVQAALAWYGERETECVEVVTQGRNIAAQQLYQRCGFLTHSVRLWYHWWFSHV